MNETRPQTVIHHVTLALARGLTMRSYAADVARLYNERTPSLARAIEFHETRDPYADERANAQIVQRFVDGRSRLPAEIEEAMVLALPEPYRGECKRDLAARYGDLAAPIPKESDSAAVADVGLLMKECGLALTELSESFGHGYVTEKTTARDALNKLTDLIATATTIRERLHAQLFPPRRNTP
ncbi:MAG TPA: hypothetical protein VFB54_03650 [Burkholderiales bacterium]|nr:hypothetical protein [Burkholderiales bacterium]